MFKKPLFILTVVAVIAISGIYMYSQSKSTDIKLTETTVLPTVENDLMNSSKSFEHILQMASSRVSKTLLDSIALLEKDIKSEDIKKQITAYKQIGDLWARSGNIICGGHYFIEKAKLSNAIGDWRFSAELMAYAADGAADSIARNYAIDNAILGFRNIIALDSSDIDAKVQLAVCLIDGKNNVMEGVTLLKQVEKLEPDHEFMNVTLGRLALISGQFDKAIPRLEHLIQKHPDNFEAYYYLSEAYKATGKKDKAIQCLEDAKKHFSKMPEAEKQIEELIQNIKKS